MLTGLRIQNFKGIEGPIEIPIKPVTLLYGVNSAGKSSVLHSMHFMRAVLENYDLSPTGSPYAADDIDLGGFLNLLHKRSIGRRMVLGYDLDLSSIDLPEYGATSSISISDKLREAYVEFGFSVPVLILEDGSCMSPRGALRELGPLDDTKQRFGVVEREVQVGEFQSAIRNANTNVVLPVLYVPRTYFNHPGQGFLLLPGYEQEDRDNAA